MSKKERVILCDTCSGKGTEYIRTSGYDSEHLKCTRCKGSGRMVITTVVTEKPYKK